MDRLRKNVDKLVSRRSDKDLDFPYDNESTGDSILAPDARPLSQPVGEWQADQWKRHLSEPAIRYNPAGPPHYDTIGRNTNFDDQSLLKPLSISGSNGPSSSITSTSNPLGLTLVHAFPEPLVDLIFVHGLGGTSVGTWSWDRDPSNFWLPWLASDAELSRSRVFTYGYDASLTGPYTTLNILDFSKDLLFRMKTYSGQDPSNRVPIGKLPIVFVVHSMGGLVAKKAYIIGKTDPQYNEMISQVSALVFLATPHKGSQLAQTLNNILKVTPGGSARAFVAELEKNSGALQDINEQFRNMCSNLELVSFYETIKTPIGGGIKRLIVERDSALLEYPGETSSSLIADHHGMAKFRDPLDSNYTNVTNVLRWLMKQLVGQQTPSFGQIMPAKSPLPHRDSLPLPSASPARIEDSPFDRLRTILGIVDHYDEDLELFTERLLPGSCQWLLRRTGFQDWAANSPKSSGLLWITGNPGSGKSTLASFVIQHLRNQAYLGTCQYHFFLAGDQTKRSLAYVLRNLAFQFALSSETYMARLFELSEVTGILFDQQKAPVIWEKIFEGILFRMPSEAPLFWVLDGLDEAESSLELLKLISKVRSATRINVLLISRPTKDLAKDVGDLLPTITHERISASDTIEDIKDYVRASIAKILPGDESQEEVVSDVMSKASGSFLWVKLALDRIRDNWYTRDDIRNALNELPAGMEPLYQRMIDVVCQQPEKTTAMATRILTWATCSFVPLDIAELRVALEPEFQGFVNLSRMAEEICGHFITVNKSKMTLIHHTARQFLLRRNSGLPLAISDHGGHEHAASVCIEFLSDSVKWRRVFSSTRAVKETKLATSKITVFDEHPFLFYALSHWTYHVSHASTDSTEFLDQVLGFMEEHCLLWIHGVALMQDLRILTRAAQDLKTYAKKRTIKSSKGPPMSFMGARDDELRQWANDVIRVVGRFGANITENPTSVYKLIVPFCPKDSIISRTFSSTVSQSGLSVRGLSSQGWDDCLARLNLGDERIAAQFLCKDTFFITLLASGGEMIVWRAETCEEARRIIHGEYVTRIAASRTSNLIASAGFKSTKVWDVTTGALLYTLPKDRHHHTRDLAFGEDDNEILLAYDDCEIQCFDLKTSEEKWRFVAKEEDSHDFSCARWVAFSNDRSRVAIVFRGRPVVVWDTKRSPRAFNPPRRCILAEDRLRSAAEGNAWNAPEVALWHPVTDHLLILYEDTKIVEWNVADDEQLVYDHTAARAISLSQDGNFLLSSDVNGTISIWIIPGYTLMYRMRYDELVTDLAFSPDSTRFYDLRGSFCNVWEPDALVRADNIDRDDMSSTYETITSEPVLASDDNSQVPITSLVCGSSDRFYCVGKEDGSVTIHAVSNGRKVRKVTNHSSSVSVIKLAWSSSEKFLASVDDSGKIIVKRLEPPTPEKDRWAVFPVCDYRTDDDAAVTQVLFSSRDEYLLVASSSYVSVLSMKKKKEICRTKVSESGGIWFTHPSNKSALVRIDASTEKQYMWKDLELRDGGSSATKQAEDLSLSSKTIEQAIQIRDQWLVIDVVDSAGHAYQRSRSLDLLDLSKLDLITTSEAATMTRQNIKGLAKHVRQLIGCFQDRVVFLDHQFWVCTWEMELVYSKHKRHFFLPKDWVSPTALRMVALSKQGTLLCPKIGEVAIVRSGLG